MERQKHAGGQRRDELLPRESSPLTVTAPGDQKGADDDERQAEPPCRDREWVGVREPRERPAERDGDDREREDEPGGRYYFLPPPKSGIVINPRV
jgi:hypothetical protein